MRFVDIFLSIHKINVSELNLKRPNVTTQCHCVQTSVYPLTTVTGGKVNIELRIDRSTPTPTAPPNTILP